MNRFGKISIEKFNEIHNKVLIRVDDCGLGDIFITRMLFEDIKKIMPCASITFACPKKYIEAASDHPFIDNVVDCKEIKESDFLIHYNTTGVCTSYEMSIAPYSDLNRSDILANYCGFKLRNHNMHIRIDEDLVAEAKNKLKNKRPCYALCPISAIASRSLTINQIDIINKHIKKENANLICLHNKKIKEIEDLGIEIWDDLSIKQWMATIYSSDYIISTDTAGFHCAGGLGKPLLGIFSFTDGKVYGKYYKFNLVQKHRDNGDWNCGPCYNWICCPKSRQVHKPCTLELTEKEILEGINLLKISI